MNLKSLELFLQLATSQNYSQTAKQMHVSPSALTRQIQKLEQEVGERLFVRDNRGVELTDAGRKLMPVAQNICQQWTLYCRAAQGKDTELYGSLRLFCSVTASFSHLPALLSNFRNTYPNIDLKLTTGDPAIALDKLFSNEADIVISALPTPVPARLAYEVIGEISLSIIEPIEANSFCYEIKQAKPDWQKIPFIIPATGIAREKCDRWFKDMKIKQPSIYAQASGHEGVVSMVALGLGIGIAPDVVIDNSPVKDKVRRIPLKAVQPFQLAICCQKSQRSMPLIKALWEISKQEIHVASTA